MAKAGHCEPLLAYWRFLFPLKGPGRKARL